MTRAVLGSLLAVAFVLSLALRLPGLDARPMHHDEANQAVKFGTLLETGDYHYDRDDHHGPTLYYLTLPVAWMRGQRSLAALDETTLRLLPALAGAALILMLGGFARGLGRTAVAAAALLAAVSPALTYYSRFYIQESLFVAFTIAFLHAFGHVVQRPGYAWAAAAGVAGGLAYATKETFVIVVAAAMAAAVVARRWNHDAVGTDVPSPRARPSLLWASVVCAAVGLAVAFVFFSSWFRNPDGFLESFRAYSTYLGRGLLPAQHVQPWYYYLGLLGLSTSGGLVWSEGLVLALAAVGIVVAWRTRAGFWPHFIMLYAVQMTLAYSAIRYKTPWNLLPFYAALILMAGYGAAFLLDRSRRRWMSVLMVAVFMAGAGHLAAQSWRASVRYAADPHNPYVYAHTAPDVLRLTGRIAALAATHPDRDAMLVKVVAGPYEQWPLPWYLRRMPHVGYWAALDAAAIGDGAPVIVASQDNVPAVDAALGERYISEMYGLRPDAFLTLYVERGLWEKLLAQGTSR